MEGKRPKRVKTEPMARHVDGHTLKAMGGLPGQGCPLRRTAELEDYGPAHPMAVTFNKEALDNGENSGFLKETGAWIDKQGVAIVQLEGELDSKQVVIELDERFKDGKLSFAAKDQIAEFHTVSGGWLEEYKNVLEPDPREQQKSVVAVKSGSFGVFKTSFPYTNDVVQEVQSAICKLMPSYTGKLVPHEYTFFFGTSKASCTKWHSDQAEHKDVVLKLTSLTLLSSGQTSMNVASKLETWLEKPFQTALFDPQLFHRSGVTSYEVIKLSIHWKLRSSPGGHAAKVKSEAGPSGSKNETEGVGDKPDEPKVAEAKFADSAEFKNEAVSDSVPPPAVAVAAAENEDEDEDAEKEEEQEGEGADEDSEK